MKARSSGLNCSCDEMARESDVFVSPHTHICHAVIHSHLCAYIDVVSAPSGGVPAPAGRDVSVEFIPFPPHRGIALVRWVNGYTDGWNG